MNIFIKFDYLQDITESEQLIIEYIKKDPQKFISKSANEISKECYISTSSLYRFCHKLECSGLADLKVKISASINDYINKNNDFDYNYPIKANETQYQITHKLKEVYEQTVISTLNILELEQLRLAVSHMLKSKQIDIYTSAGNIYFAQNFQFQMQEIGINVNVPMEEYHQRLMASYSDSSHIAIVISFGGRGLVIQNLIKSLKLTKTPIIMITSPNSPIEKYGDYILYMNPHEDHYNKISSFSTRLSLLYILDSLYTCYFKMNYDENIDKKINHYHVLSNTRGGKV